MRSSPPPNGDHDLHDADDRHDDAQQHDEQLPVLDEQVRADQIEGPARDPCGQAHRVPEALQDGLLGDRAVLAGADAVLQGICDRGPELALDIGPLRLRDAAHGGGKVALGELGHRSGPPFMACRDAVRSVMSFMSCAASSTPVGLVR